MAASAQGSAAPPPDAPPVTITVSGQRTSDRASVTPDTTGLPTGVTVIDHEELERSNLGRDVATLLRRIPGAMTHNLGQGDTGTSVKLRGFFSSSHGADVAVYIDGMPQNVPSSVINHGMNDMSWLTPDMIERIEIIKGPFSALYGDQNRSGAINIVTRTGGQNSVAVTVSSFNTKRASLTLAGPLGPVQTLLVTDLFDTKGWRDNSEQTRGSALLKGSLNDGVSAWALRGTHYQSHWNAPGFLNQTSLLSGAISPQSRDLSSPPLFGKARRSSLVFTRDPAGLGTGLHATAFFEDYHRTRALGFDPSSLNVQQDDRHAFGGRALYDLGAGRTGLLTVGAESRGDKGTAVNQRWVNGAPTANYLIDQNLDLLNYAVFAQGQYKLLDGVKLVAGVRRDQFDYDIGNARTPAASVHYRQGVTTPRGGIVWSPNSRFDIFANVGDGFRSPGQAELSPSPSTAGPLGAAGGTPFPDLKPPKVRSKDIGFEARIVDGWRLYGAAYHTLNGSEIAQVSPGVFAPVGNTQRDGWEVETRYVASDLWGVYASWGRISKAQILSAAPGTANLLAVPKDNYKAGVNYGLPIAAGLLLLNADASYISGVPFFAGTPLSQQFARPYSRYDFRATYDLRQMSFTFFATLQPIKDASEVATSSTAGVLVDPRPKTDVGLVAKFRF